MEEFETWYDMLFKNQSLFLDIFMVMFSVVFLAVMANIRIPLWPVPITMQTFGIWIIAFFFGSRKSFLSVMAYILAGLVGFSVFAGYSSGFGVILGPTGGYIIGFLAAAFLVGHMVEKGHGRTRKGVLACILAGNLVIYIFGLTGLGIYLGNAGFVQLLMLGAVPFIIGDILKALAAAAIFPFIWKH